MNCLLPWQDFPIDAFKTHIENHIAVGGVMVEFKISGLITRVEVMGLGTNAKGRSETPHEPNSFTNQNTIDTIANYRSFESAPERCPALWRTEMDLSRGHHISKALVLQAQVALFSSRLCDHQPQKCLQSTKDHQTNRSSKSEQMEGNGVQSCL